MTEEFICRATRDHASIRPMTQTLHTAPGPQLPRPRPAVLATAAAVLAGGLGVWLLGGPPGWPAVLMPLSLAICAAGWAGGTPRRVRRALPWGLLGLVGVQIALWLPLMLTFYVGGEGAARLDYALGAALFTALTVGWYVGTQYWGIALATLALAAGLLAWRRMGREAL